MSNPNRDPQSPNTYCSPALRDKIFAHLPPQVREAQREVIVTYWPKGGEEELKFTIRYKPGDHLLAIESIEGIYHADLGHISGDLIRGCYMDPETAEVSDYEETVEPYARESAAPTPMSNEAIRLDATALEFSPDKEQYFLDLFDRL